MSKLSQEITKETITKDKMLIQENISAWDYLHIAITCTFSTPHSGAAREQSVINTAICCLWGKTQASFPLYLTNPIIIMDAMYALLVVFYSEKS